MKHETMEEVLFEGEKRAWNICYVEDGFVMEYNLQIFKCFTTPPPKQKKEDKKNKYLTNRLNLRNE